MIGVLGRYVRWLHLQWPAGRVEQLPVVGDAGKTAVPGVRVVGDLSGVPLLKFASETAATAVRAILSEPDFAGARGSAEVDVDLAVIGGGVSGISAAIEGRKAGLRVVVYEAARPFATLANFPKGKPIYTYPAEMEPSGGLHFPAEADTRETLLEAVERQRIEHGIEPDPDRVARIERRDGRLRVVFEGDREPVRALRVIVAIGRSGNHRRLGCPGEDLPKVSNRLHDPAEFAGREVLVVGGGDSAIETAVALAGCGARVTLSYRRREFARVKAANLERLEALARDPRAPVHLEEPSSERVTSALTDAMRESTPVGALRLALGTEVERIEPDAVLLRPAGGGDSGPERIPNDAVFTMLGREAPLGFFRRSGIPVAGDWRWTTVAACVAFFLFCVFVYQWKGGTDLKHWFQQEGWFPFNVSPAVEAALPAFAGTALGKTVSAALGSSGFYYSLAYCACVVGFGIDRIRRRRTPYIRLQTLTLMAIQCVPLFLLPYFVLPWMGHAGWFDGGAGKWIADQLFPVSGGGREYWRAFGLFLAWPLFIWNVFTEQPLWLWLAISVVQTFVLIPWMIRRWGKGAYCGWICSCGALAETLGDRHRQKMPHGPVWNRLNLVGQVILVAALLLAGARVWSWIPGAPGAEAVRTFYYGLLSGWSVLGVKLNYYHTVDLFLAGVVGVGLYFWFSGRVWCRFACPLAALMHVYARFSRFRIFPEKSKCISCNVCTSVCHQGIDVMAFANKGMPMEDPECVRCSACVQQCPTGVLAFGRLGEEGVPVLDRLAASPVRMREGHE